MLADNGHSPSGYGDDDGITVVFERDRVGGRLFHPASMWWARCVHGECQPASLIHDHVESIDGSMRARVAATSDGRAVLAWERPFDPRGGLWTSRFEPARGWGPAAPVPGGPLDPYPNIFRDGSETDPGTCIATAIGGEILLAWREREAGTVHLFVATFHPDTGWTPPYRVQRRDANWASQPACALDGAGHGLVSWGQVDQVDGRAFQRTWMASFTRGSGWTLPALFQEQESVSGGPIDAAYDDMGNALLLFVEDLRFRVRRFDATRGWQSPESLTTRGRDLGSGRLAMNESGAALVVWTEGTTSTSGLTEYAVWAARFDPTSGWWPPEAVESSTGRFGGFRVRAGLDRRGNGVVAWETDLAWASSHVRAGGRWSPPQVIPGPLAFPFLRLIVSPGGDVLAVWSSDSTVLASRLRLD